MSIILEVQGLSKKYPGSDFSLSDVSFKIPAGTIMGFVGENGAGKTTAIGCILGTLVRDSGTVKIFGKEMTDGATDIRNDIGVAFLVTGISAFHTFFIAMVIVAPAYSVITSIAGGYASKYSSNWERFQLAMPVRRRDVTVSQYLCIVIASLVGVPFIAVIMGIGIAVHESLRDIAAQVISSAVSIFSISLGTVLLLGALFFPLTCTKFSKNKGEALAFVCLTVALGIVGLVTYAGFRLSLSQYTESLLRVAASAIPFVLSYILTKKLYAKLDL